MYFHSKHILMQSNRRMACHIITALSQPKGCYPVYMAKHIHKAASKNEYYDAAEPLPIPNNIDPAETTRFSPQRTRDVNATVLVSQFHHASPLNIDITSDSTIVGSIEVAQDPHIQSYDCNSAVCLNSAMQSNVPSPFGGMHKFSHLNMPGGQWSQDSKFVSTIQHNSHYTALRNNVRANWAKYDEKQVVTTDNSNQLKARTMHTNVWQMVMKRHLCTKTELKEQNVKSATQQEVTRALTKKEQLKNAFKQYGATIVVFHVAISLASLGGFYLLVSSGVDLMPIIEKIGLAMASNKIAASASTFVVAYGVHKIFAPVRITITLSATPFIVRYLRSRGLLRSKDIK